MFLSHSKFNEKHSLVKHSIEVAKKTREILDETHLDISELGFYAGLLHDIGKLNPIYQQAFSENDKLSVERKLSEPDNEYIRMHAPFSEFMSQGLLDQKIQSQENKDSISAVIYYHHGSLKRTFPNNKNDKRIFVTQEKIAASLKEFQKEALGEEEFVDLDWNRCHTKMTGKLSSHFDLQEYSRDYFDVYIKNSCLFSALLQADKGSFKDWKLLPFDINIQTSEFASSKTSISDFRTKFQTQVIANIDLSNAINLLEAPTGIGKTKAFLDIITKYKNQMSLERVFYFSPLLALTDDFEKQIKEKHVIPEDQMGRILEYTHLFSGTLEDKKSNSDETFIKYDWSFEDESFNQNFIITTTARLLMMLYSNKNKDKLKLISLKKSLLIIDEVQTLPKFILPNLISYLEKLAKFIDCKILLVSATIPHHLRQIPKINIDKNIFEEYLANTEKKITFSSQLQIGNTDGKQILVMANTRRHASQIYLEYIKKSPENRIFYLSSGVIKKDRVCRIDNLLVLLKNKQDALCVATQVIEAGINISFSHIFREAAPLDSIVQVMGRLNRDMEYSDALLTIYQQVDDPLPYNEIEYNESVSILKKIQNSKELYNELGAYYKKITERNQSDRNRARFLEDDMKDMDFQTIWEKVRKYTYEEYERDTVIIPPDVTTLAKIRKQILDKGEITKEIRRNCAKYSATLPINAHDPKIVNMFDEQLMELNLLIPKPQYLSVIYDSKGLGLDKWLIDKTVSND